MVTIFVCFIPHFSLFLSFFLFSFFLNSFSVLGIKTRVLNKVVDVLLINYTPEFYTRDFKVYRMQKM